MKRLLLPLMLVLLLWGCSAEKDYLSVEPHVEIHTTQPTTQPKEELPLAENRSQLRSAVLSLVRNWSEHGQILVRSYDGDVNSDLNEVILYTTQEDPYGAYAVDYVDVEFSGTEENGVITVSIIYRRSSAESKSIQLAGSMNGAYGIIREALTSYSPYATIRIRNYREADISSYIRSYCLENPHLIVAVPTFSAAVYPKEGSVRILEVHFTYPELRDSLREKQSSLQQLLSSSAAHVKQGATPKAKVERLHEFLTSRARYSIVQEEPQMPAYELLLENKAHSLSFSTVFRYQCETAGLRCRMIQGERNGQAHYWNLLYLENRWYHIDLLRSVELGEQELVLLYDEDLLEEGYSWSSEDYPAITRPIESDPAAPDEPIPEETNPGETTESESTTENNIPTEPEPTESSAETTESQEESQVPTTTVSPED